MSRTQVVRVGRPRDGPAERVRAGRPSVWRSTRRLPPRHGRGVRRTRHRRHVVRTRRSRAGRTARPIPRGSGGAAPTAPPVRPRRSRMAFHPTNPPIRYRRAPSDQIHLSNRLPCPDRAPPTCDSATRKCHKLVRKCVGGRHEWQTLSAPNGSLMRSARFPESRINRASSSRLMVVRFAIAWITRTAGCGLDARPGAPLQDEVDLPSNTLAVDGSTDLLRRPGNARAG